MTKHLVGMIAALCITWGVPAFAGGESGEGVKLKVRGTKPLVEGVPGEYRVKVRIKLGEKKRSKLVSLTPPEWEFVFSHEVDIRGEFDKARGSVAR